jgi:hypothetical protein
MLRFKHTSARMKSIILGVLSKCFIVLSAVRAIMTFVF